jgi:uncharacterized protein YuzE
MRASFSTAIDMAYIYLTAVGDAHSVKHTEPLIIDLPGGSQWLNLDFDAEGRLLGIEVARAATALPGSLLEAADRPGSLHRW